MAACRAGAVAVEFSLVIGVMVLLIFGVFHLGRALMALNEMNHALAEAVRVVHLRPTASPEAIEAALEVELRRHAGSEAEAEVTRIAGTSFMAIVVRFPYRLAVPFLAPRDLPMRVEHLAPMVSATPD